MAEYLIQGETLTGIADKIRPLLGLTGTMTPEQMQTNLATEQANIAAALAALTEKGVEVPAGAYSNALAGLIGAIEAGGGGVFGESAASGSFTLTAQAASHTIEHGLGRTPAYAIVFLGAQKAYTRTGYLLIFAAGYSSPEGDRQSCVFGTTNSTNSASYKVSKTSVASDPANADVLWYYSTPIYGANENTISVGDALGEKNTYLMASRPYYWIVW